MTREEAKTEIMQIYGSLSEEKKMALDVLMAQADGEYITQSAGDEIRQKNYDLISRQAVQNYIAHFLSLYLQDNVREAVEAIDEVIGDMPSVDIPPEHDGCKDCKYETYPDYYYPCCSCKQNYEDEWQKKPHWIIIDDCEKYIAKCSECGQIEDSRMIGKYAYCHCGARMVEPQEISDRNLKLWHDIYEEEKRRTERSE